MEVTCRWPATGQRGSKNIDMAVGLPVQHGMRQPALCRCRCLLGPHALIVTPQHLQGLSGQQCKWTTVLGSCKAGMRL